MRAHRYRRWALVGGLVLVIGASGIILALPTNGDTVRTVTYCREDGQSLSMTLFSPSAGRDPAPVVVQVHGGGWQHGSRLSSLAGSHTAAALVGAGFMVASIDYRLAPTNPWPDQIVDMACAVRFLHARGRSLGIDPARIAAWGDSAGGQLVSLLGVDGANRVWDRGPYPDASSHVDAIVDEYGPANLNATDWPHSSAEMIRTVFGVTPRAQDPTLAAASPLHHVATGDPPFMIIQGTADRVVPAAQSEELAARLRAVGTPVDLVLVDRGGHGLTTPGESPSPAAVSSSIVTYLRRALHS
jgi:acetyl esterase/lipase